MLKPLRYIWQLFPTWGRCAMCFPICTKFCWMKCKNVSTDLSVIYFFYSSSYGAISLSKWWQLCLHPSFYWRLFWIVIVSSSRSSFTFDLPKFFHICHLFCLIVLTISLSFFILKRTLFDILANQFIRSMHLYTSQMLSTFSVKLHSVQSYIKYDKYKTNVTNLVRIIRLRSWL